MEILIRTQDREKLIPIKEGFQYSSVCNKPNGKVEGHYVAGFSNGSMMMLGQYASKKRVLEVMDEIQKQAGQKEAFDMPAE